MCETDHEILRLFSFSPLVEDGVGIKMWAEKIIYNSAWLSLLSLYSVNFLIYCVAGRQFRTGLKQMLRIQSSPRINEVIPIVMAIL